MRQFLAEPFVRILLPSSAVAQRYGWIVAQLRNSGSPIPTNDIWIAACALDAGASLLTFDEHFTRVEGLVTTTPEG